MTYLPPGTTVLQVLPRLDTGGVERGTVEVAQAIRDAGARALVASAGGRLVPLVQRTRGRHAILPLDTKTPWGIWQNARRLEALVRTDQVSVVHARSRAPAWSAMLAARRAGVPFVTTYHGVYTESWPGKWRYNAVMAAGDRVIAISHHVADVLTQRHGVGPDRLRIIPRGVDPAVFDPDAVAAPRIARLAATWRVPDGAPTVVLPARLTRWKGASVLLRAMALLDRLDACCVLVGAMDGRERFAAELVAEAEALGIAGRLRMVGHCDDMPAALMLADVVVSASVEPEGFGRAVIEAQAMGRMVVATDHGGAAETVRHGDTGWRVPPNDPVALAAAIGRALQLTVEEGAAMGARSRASVLSDYTVSAMQAATLAVYREVLTSR